MAGLGAKVAVVARTATRRSDGLLASPVTYVATGYQPQLKCFWPVVIDGNPRRSTSIVAFLTSSPSTKSTENMQSTVRLRGPVRPSRQLTLRRRAAKQRVDQWPERPERRIGFRSNVACHCDVFVDEVTGRLDQALNGADGADEV